MSAAWKEHRLSVWTKAALSLILVGVLGFTALFSVVVVGDRDEIRGEPQAMVVLGCQVKPWGPSILLQDRLDTALDYLEEHPELPVVVSGGQGGDEPVSEAQCMFDYLTEHGVKEERILMEDRSSNTAENVRFTKELLNEQGLDPEGPCIIVSNGFHLARVRMLWGNSEELSTLAAPSSHAPSRIKMYIREPFALVKSFLFD